jgi:hypothetical protein
MSLISATALSEPFKSDSEQKGMASSNQINQLMGCTYHSSVQSIIADGDNFRAYMHGKRDPSVPSSSSSKGTLPEYAPSLAEYIKYLEDTKDIETRHHRLD